MIAPRWRKVLRDTLERPGRSLLAVIAMAAGVFQVAALIHKYAILEPLLRTFYADTRPAAVVLLTDRVDDAALDSVRMLPGVEAVEARPVIVARARIGPAGDEEWMPAVVNVIRDYDRQQTDTFKPHAGAWPPGEGDVLLERSALQMTGIGEGDTLWLRSAAGDEVGLRMAGSVHAPGLAPAWMEHMVPAYVSWSSAARAALGGESAQIRLRVREHANEEGYLRELAGTVQAALERKGVSVSRVMYPPSRHPHAAQMATFLYLLGAFGLLSLGLSAVLVAGMIHGLIAEQIRQVGIMKAIGATTRQIAGLYLGQVGLLAAVAILLGVPPGLWVGRRYAEFSAGILNVDITRVPFPWLPLLVVVAVGVVLPLLVALGPVSRASRITVQQALNDDLGPRPFGTRRLERWLSRVTWLPRPWMLSLRTTALRRGRLALTVGTLAVAGAVFMSALNVAGAWNHAVNQDFARRRYDLTVILTRPHPVVTLDSLITTVAGVVDTEFWPGSTPSLIGPGGVAGENVALLGLDPDSRLLELPLTAGRWLRADDADGVVVNRAVLKRNPSLTVGGSVALRLEGRTVSFPIIGIVRELAPAPVVYAGREAVLKFTGQTGDVARTVRVVIERHDNAAQRAAARAIEERLSGAEVEVAGVQRMLDVRKSILDHLVIVMGILTLASVVVVFVGAVGLTSTLTLGVVQRTREFGILGAIGAAPATIARQVWLEAVVIGLLSWAVAVALAAPLSYLIEAVTGRIFFEAPLEFYVSAAAAGTWLVLVLVLASASSLYPARRASGLTVREALAYA